MHRHGEEARLRIAGSALGVYSRVWDKGGGLLGQEEAGNNGGCELHGVDICLFCVLICLFTMMNVLWNKNYDFTATKAKKITLVWLVAIMTRVLVSSDSVVHSWIIMIQNQNKLLLSMSWDHRGGRGAFFGLLYRSLPL